MEKFTLQEIEKAALTYDGIEGRPYVGTIFEHIKKQLTRPRIEFAGPIDDLKKAVAYNKNTGEFFWISERSGAQVGQKAGNVNMHGYVTIKIDQREYQASHLAWAFSTGKFPEEEIDHINHDRADNRLSNLRAVSHAENCKNRSEGSNNTSGRTGVYYDKRADRWRATITVDGNLIRLGWFRLFDDAVAAREAAEEEYGFHENHGAKGDRDE